MGEVADVQLQYVDPTQQAIDQHMAHVITLAERATLNERVLARLA